MGIVIEKIDKKKFKVIDTNPFVGEHEYEKTTGDGPVFLRVKRS